MLIDPHIHTKEISKCASFSIKDAIDYKISLGFSGAVLVNHCQPWYYNKEDHLNEMKKHIEVFKEGLEYAKSKNFILIFGIEVSLTKPSYADYLIYGIDEDFLLDSECLYDLTVEELHRYTLKHNCLLIEAHPFRDGCHIQDPLHIDGVELNAQLRDVIHKDEVIDYAIKNKKIITCGCDFHNESHSFTDGIIIDDEIKDSKDLVKVLKEGKYKITYKGEIIEKVSYI